MTAAELVRQLLVDAPGDALCDACRALACGTTLTEMREITGGLTAADPAIQRAATCASCRRTVAAVVFEVPIPKCAHCGGPLNEGEDGVIIDGDRFHDVCMRRLNHRRDQPCVASTEPTVAGVDRAVATTAAEPGVRRDDVTDYDNRTEWRAECPTTSADARRVTIGDNGMRRMRRLK